MWLKFKIFIGYVIMTILSAVVLVLFHNEYDKKKILKSEKQELSDIRNLIQQTHMCLLDLSSQAEVASVWTKEDFDLYKIKQEETRRILVDLKFHIQSAEQEARIDTFYLLLEEKKHLLVAIMNTFEQLAEVNNMVKEKIPVIAFQAQKEPETKEEPFPKELEKKNERKGFLGIFRKKESKSVYRQQREREEKKQKAKVQPHNTAVTLLYSLNREMTEKQKLQQHRLLQQMDSLYINNQTLNKKFYELISAFDKESNLHLSERYSYMLTDWEESFRLITGIAIFAFILVIILYIIVHRDVNKRHCYEKDLEKSDRENKELLHSKKNMMMSIAHDLRAPLAVIKGSADLLPGEEDKVRQDEYIENIRHSSDYMLRLVNTLIEFYLLDTNHFKLNNSIFRLEILFKEIATNYLTETKKKNLQFITDFRGLDIIVNGDRMRIQQIVSNLLTNAVKFTKQGKICFHAEYTKGELHFSVQDTGMGISEEEKARIFKAFERLDNAHNISGFGLGLTISAKLVSQMNGAMTVESKLEKGSTFMVFLPLPEADESSRIDEAVIIDFHLDGVRVLVIDDDRIQLNITKEIFKRYRIICDCCKTSRELFAKLREQDYDLILTDIQMPETDGYEILELLRCSNIKAARSIPVVAMTARANDESEYISCGFAGCIHKPFTMEELMNTVMRITGQKEKQVWEPDFSLILSGEDNRQEMLDLLIAEMRKDLAVLTHALERQDREAAVAVLHKNLPLWITVRLDISPFCLKRLVTGDTRTWEEEQYTEIRKIISAVEKLITYSENILETNENNPDS